MADEARQGRVGTAVRALQHRNYRLFFAGQLVSLIGTWMQMVATSWLVYRLTNSPYWLGVVGFVSRLPQALLTPVAGVLVDRWDRHRVVLWAQVLAMLQALALGVLALSGQIHVYHVAILGFGLGMVNAFDVPGRQALVIELVEDRADLSSAIALNSSIFNMARLLGPAVAGVLTAYLGEGLCFILNSISYIAVIWALLAMTLPVRERPSEPQKVLDGLREGLSYAWSVAPIRSLLGLIAFISLVSTPYMVLLPSYAKDWLHAGAQGYGWLMGASGLGALIGAVHLASRRTVVGLERQIAFSSTSFGLALVGLALSQTYALSFALTMATGFSMITVMASGNTVVQTIVDDDKRGRVMSLHALAIMGTAPLGGLLGGVAAQHWGVPHTVLAGGVAAALAGVVFAIRVPRFAEKIRPVYVEKGILEEV